MKAAFWEPTNHNSEQAGFQSTEKTDGSGQNLYPLSYTPTKWKGFLACREQAFPQEID